MVKKSKLLPVLACLLLVPAFIAQPTGEINEEILATPGTDITFYGHTLGLGSPGRTTPMPMNTQFPEGANDFSRGFVGGPCNYPAAADPDDGSSCYQDTYWYTTAGFVQVKDPDSWGGDYSKFHNERGQTKDIYFDTDRAPVSTMYMSADGHPWLLLLCDPPVSGPCWGWDPGYMPEFVVETWMWHANLGEWSKDPESRPNVDKVANRADDITLIAHGASDPEDLLSLDPTIPTGEGTVWPISSELEWDPEFVAAGGVVPYLNDLIIEHRWYEKDAATGEQYFIGGIWNLNAGEDFPNNIVMPVRNPLDVELVFPRFVHDKLVILSVLNTPWGSYDVDLNSIDIAFRNEAGATIEPSEELFQKFLDQSVAHSGHYDPINLTWIWDYQEDALPAGEYDIVVSATNFQGSYSTETVASFTIKKDGTGGEATAAQSGILSFSQDQFQSYQEGAGVGDETNTESSQPDGGAKSESKGSPGFGAFAGLAAIGALAILRRKNQ